MSVPLSAAFTTLGCKVNQYETQAILDRFEAAGFRIVPFESAADVYVINTCSVTSVAESKSRYTIRRATRHNPNAKVVVTGCAAQMSLNKSESMAGADVVVPNPEKLETLDYLFRAYPEWARHVEANPHTEPRDLPARTRATLKVQDGCSVYCSYCSIPYTRPKMVSRPVTAVLDEARRMADQGFREAILTGVLIGSYGPETGSEGPDFPELVERIARESGLGRLRISSIEMQQVTPRLVELVRAGLVVPHFHIPLQSGDSTVLRDMNRPYDQDDYLRLCDWLKAEIPDLTLTTDIMVGFPTETDERFESSVHVCERAEYLKVHAFTFSPRFGTPADAFGDPVPPAEKQRRRQALIDVSARTATAHQARFLGRTMRVLVEGKVSQDGRLQGLTDNYLSVKFAGPRSLVHEFCWVRLDDCRDGALTGELMPGPVNDALRVLA